MRNYFALLLIVVYCLFSCESNNNYAPYSNTDEPSHLIQLKEKGPAGKPRITKFNTDSLKITKAIGRKISINPTESRRNQLSKFKAGLPKIRKIDSNALKVFTPGVNGVRLPIKYTIPQNGILVQNGDTVRSPQINIAVQPAPTSAQPMRFRDAALYDIQFLDVEQGLPSSYVDALYEDPSGNMWFGTYGGGVTRYDGKTLTTFTENEGLPNNVVQCILKDSSGNLWFGSDGRGMSKYDGNTFTNYSREQGFGGNYVETITEDKHGNIWFGTNGRGLTKYTPGVTDSFTIYTTETGLASNNVWSSIVDSEGNLWFGTRNGLSKYDGKSFTNFDDTNGLPDNIVRSLYQDKNGLLWIGTEGGVSIYDGESFTIFTRDEGLKNHRVWSICEDNLGNIWLGTDGGGVCRLSGGNNRNFEELYFTYYTQTEGLSYNFVRSMIADSRGNMWFGIDGGGIAKFKTNSFTSFTDNPHLSANTVWSIFEDNSGTLWFGSDVWGIYQYKDDVFKTFMDKERLLEYSVMDMVEDKNGNIWFATYGSGIVKYDGNSFISFNEQDGFPYSDVYTMLEDKNGDFWFGTQGGGLVKYDGHIFTTYGIKDGLPNNRIWNIIEDKKGFLWIGSFGGGLTRFDGESFITYTEKEGLLNNSVNSILEDHEGNIWLGTDGGVSKMVFDTTSTELSFALYHLTTADGLTNSITLSLVEDKEYNIWIGTEGGINRLSPSSNGKEFNESYQLNTFVQLDGLKGLDVVINSVCIDTQNRIWWGTGKGLAMMDIANLKFNGEAPKLQLNGISIGQEYVDFRSLKEPSYRKSIAYGNALFNSFDSIVPYQNRPVNLSLPHHLNHITFNFSAIDWVSPHKLKYQYKLVGQDENWSNLNSDIMAEYRNLGYGEYVFKVKAIGVANKWSETIEYPFEIIRPWWHSWWARISYLVIGALIIYCFDRWRTLQLLQKQKMVQKNIEDRNRELEILVRERTAEIKRQQQLTEQANLILEQKVRERTNELVEKNKKLSEYAFVNAHNLRVPVANIKGIIQLFELVKSPEERRELIDLLKGQSDSLDSVLYEIKEMLERDNSQ